MIKFKNSWTRVFKDHVPFSPLMLKPVSPLKPCSPISPEIPGSPSILKEIKDFFTDRALMSLSRKKRINQSKNK